MKNKLVRLVKLISHAGICSRRDAEKLIISGEVLLNGKPYRDFTINSSLINRITIHGQKLKFSKTRLWCLNKTVGLLCSNNNQYKEKTIFDILPKALPRLVSVGRLDLRSEGLLLLTTNPKLSYYLENPKNKVNRKYYLKIFGDLNSDKKRKMQAGMHVNGINYQPLKISNIIKIGKEYEIEIEIQEGKNKELRNIMNSLNLKVNTLKRLEYGPFQLLNLKENQVYEIPQNELKKKLLNIGFADIKDF